MRSEAWRILRRRPVFWLSVAIVAVILAMAAFPGLFTGVDPADCTLTRSMRPPGGGAWFGYDVQGCDVFSRTVHGARSSFLVAGLATLLAVCMSAAVVLPPGYFGVMLEPD